MKKILLYIIGVFLISCCDDSKLPDNYLEGNVKKLTEYNMSVGTNPLNNQVFDTLSTSKKIFNELNQIVELNQINHFAEITMDIKYIYNRCDRIQKEIVKMSFDSLPTVVNYLYDNSMVKKSFAESIRDSIYFRQVGKYKYNHNEELIETTLSQVFINLKSNDTIKYSIQTDTYGTDGILTKTKWTHAHDTDKSRSSVYVYHNKELVETRFYDKNDSLLNIFRFEYIKDETGNWIELKSFDGDILDGIKTRVIEYVTQPKEG